MSALRRKLILALPALLLAAGPLGCSADAETRPETPQNESGRESPDQPEERQSETPEETALAATTVKASEATLSPLERAQGTALTLTLENESNQTHTLIGIFSPRASRGRLQLTTGSGADNQTTEAPEQAAASHGLTGVVLEQRKTVRLGQQGLQAVLSGWENLPLRQDDEVPVMLLFSDGSHLEVTARAAREITSDQDVPASGSPENGGARQPDEEGSEEAEGTGEEEPAGGSENNGEQNDGQNR